MGFIISTIYLVVININPMSWFVERVLEIISRLFLQNQKSFKNRDFFSNKLDPANGVTRVVKVL